MKAESIKKYLRPDRIAGRKSTFAGAFASALAPYEEYDADSVRRAMEDLGQDPDDLCCSYCGAPAPTWDHLSNRVVRGEFSGHGHFIRNLVPCCRSCNERKGGRTWEAHIDRLGRDDAEERKERIRTFIRHGYTQVTTDELREAAPEAYDEFVKNRDEVFRLIARSDDLAKEIREAYRRRHEKVET